MSPRYPFAPLAKLMGLSENAAAKQLRISGSTEQEYRTRGMSERVADRLAVKAGFVPYEVWPEMLEHQIVDSAQHRQEQLRRARRKYRSTKKGREATRRANRAYYQRTAEYVKSQSARYRAENIDRVRERDRAYVHPNPERKRALQREAARRYRERNRELVAQKQREYRARKKKSA